MHNKLLTNYERKRRHLTVNNLCPRCNAQDESVSHVLRDCQYAVDVWKSLELQAICSNQNPLCAWLADGMKHQQGMLFGIGCWYLWKARNEWVFSAKSQPPASLAGRISSWSRIVDSAMTRDSLISAVEPPSHQHASEVIAIRELLQRNWQVEIRHIYREGNGATDFLANMGHSLDPGFHFVPTSDSNLGYFLRKDCMRIADLRMIP
ncbi:Putative ribonuclease H protein At1g65750 [Linum perenne]